MNQACPNIAYIDGQNLTKMYAKHKTWKIDYARLRVYLKQKYCIDRAYYYIGVFMEQYTELYNALQQAGYIVVFREHSQNMRSIKKGKLGAMVHPTREKASSLYKKLGHEFYVYLDDTDVRRKIEKKKSIKKKASP